MRPAKPETVWPTAEQLEQMGFVRCADHPVTGCTTYVDPANVPSKTCRAHQRRTRQPRWRDR